MLTKTGQAYRGKIVYYKGRNPMESFTMYFGPHHTPGPVKAKMTIWKKHKPRDYVVLSEAVQVSVDWEDIP